MTMTREDLRGHTIFLYKLTTDNGGAPCSYADVLSLAICKPDIRTSARVGDWVVGFGGKSVPDIKGRLIYIAEVTSVAENGAYYTGDEYRSRPDCVYKRNGSGYAWRNGSAYHSREQLEVDLGSPNKYERARVLLSENFVYCGRTLKPSIKDVVDIYNDLPRNYVKNYTEETRARVEQLIVYVMNGHPTRSSGRPTHGDKGRRCNESENDVVKLAPLEAN